MKILFVHEVSYRKKPVFEIHEFPELLAKNGHDITFFEFDEGRKFWQSGNSKINSEIAGKVISGTKLKIDRPVQLGIPGLDRLFVVLSSVPRLWKLIRTNRYDAIVLYAVPTYGFQTLFIAKTVATPVMFRALDVSHKIRSSWLSPLIKVVEKFVYRNTNLLSANNPAMAEYCRSVSAKDISTVVHFPPLDLEHFHNPGQDSSLRESLGIKNEDKVIVYMGSFFYFSGLPEALKSFANQDETNLKLLLIGGGEQSKELRELAESLGVSDNVIFTGFVSYSDLPRYLALADIAINTLSPTLVSNMALPNKVLQYLATGLPVVSTELAGLFGLFADSPRMVWEATPALVMDKAVGILLENSLASSIRADYSQNTDLELFKPETAAKAFESALVELSKESGL